MVAGGDAIGRGDDGRVVFIAGALPGETVTLEITDQRRDFSRARVVEVLDPSPFRVAAPCAELARGCGGCQWQHVTAEGQRVLKAGIITDALRRQAGVEDAPMRPTIELATTAYRTTLRAAVRDGRAAYRNLGSNDVTAVDGCLVAHPLVEDLLVNGRYGDAREVTLRCGARTGERLASPSPSHAAVDVPADVRRDHIHEVVAGRLWRISARSFFQGRPDGADALAALVTVAAGNGVSAHVVDLYSGVGLFAGVLADRGWRVTAVEGSASSVADARVNLSGAVTIVAADVTRWTAVPADLVVADPSRDGLRRAGVAVVSATGASRVVLVSCDAAAFGRDTRLLVDAGYRLTAVTPVDMFPQSFHVEIVAVFDR